MKIKFLSYIILGLAIAMAIGYMINHYPGAIYGIVFYLNLMVVISIVLGLTKFNPVEKSIYERRKKEE